MFHQASISPEKYKERTQELENHLSMLSMLNPQDAEVIKYRAILNKVCAQA
jgi:DNA-directed RNA polymerase sigma subunit (sigma70/sigma32)